MEITRWIWDNWFDLLQTVGIIGGLFFTAYTVRKDDKARQIGNAIAIKQQYRDIWKELYDRPQLFRILKKDADLTAQPVSNEEQLFVEMLILHLDTAFRAEKAGMFVKLEGLRKDIEEIFSLPIPKIVWEKFKEFQDTGFVQFIEANLK